jgi:ubiquinone/menaquinone biosynthesis C-methylase UbiE
MEHRIGQVRAFWNTEACGTDLIKSYKDEKDFYLQYSAFRYKTEWHIPLLVPFDEARGQRVLEIGCGNGADGVKFAEHGAFYTGIDLTETAISATKRHFEILGLKGVFQIENAEALSFEDNSFDMVYSYGVLHHTPNPAKAIQEVHRVLKPGGRAIIMLYHKYSFNYYVRIMSYMRLRVIFKMLSRVGSWNEDRTNLANKSLVGLRGNSNPSVWQLHYENFLKYGWSYLKAENFVHHSTDGPECVYAYVFTRSKVNKLFSMFKEIKTKVAHFPLKKYGWSAPLSIEKYLASTLGWHLFVYVKK